MTMLSAIQAASRDLIANRKPTDIFFRDSALLFYLMGRHELQGIDKILLTANDLIDGGLAIRVPLSFGMSKSGPYGVTTEMVAADVHADTAARFPLGGIYATEFINLSHRVQNAAGDAQIVNLIDQKQERMQRSVRYRLAQNIVLGQAGFYGLSDIEKQGTASSDCALGLADLFNTNTAVAYGGITEAECPQWKAKCMSKSGQVFGYAMAQSLISYARVGDSIEGEPDAIFTTYTLLDAYRTVAQLQQQYTTDDEVAKAGFKSCLCNGVKIIADQFYETHLSGYADAINSRHLFLKTVKGYAFTQIVWDQLSPTTPDRYIGHCRWIGQLYTDHRASCARYYGLVGP